MRNFKYLLLAVVVSTSFIIGCSGDDNDPDPDPPAVATCSDQIQNQDETGVDCGGVCAACPDTTPAKNGSIDSQDDVDLDPAGVEGEVNASVTLSAAQTWVLSGALTVTAGNTLTIEAGTRIEAQAGGTDVYIAIEQGATINAAGTMADPIVITSTADNPRPGDWGGLILAGRAPINTGETAEAEVVGLTYGGTAADDNSGTLTYVQVEFTGARINGEQEFNGITFYGVGSGTTVNHVSVFNGADDGIEWFGGTVNVDNALVVNATDDMFDWAEGWTGTGTNFYGVRDEGFLNVTDDPRGIEADSNSSNNDAEPRSNPTINDITLINAANVVMADMIKIRRGSGATITNALVGFVGEDASAGDFIDLTDSAGPAAGTTSIGVSVDGGVDDTDIKNEVGATITIEVGNTGADASVFAWTGFEFPANPEL
ncbi:hypothetical protein [Flagellimonas sp. HSM57]|nr:hypothetical protein [Flagellimonas sp. HSM57]